MIFVIYTLAIFFAMNMGGASFAASFSAPYGGKVLSQKSAALLFVFFVLLGAFLFGQNVAVTLGENIVSADYMSARAVAVVFLSAGLSMFVANLTNIPQSTSLVTVAAIAGVGLYVNDLNTQTIWRFIPFWILLPLISYVLTYLLAGQIYPPRKSNFWIYQKFVNQRSKLRKFVVIASCYNAFSVGTNNVGNVVGPMISESGIPLISLLMIFAVLYGGGAYVFTGPIKTAGNKIVPLGLLTASIISFISGTLMIIASAWGVPQSFVMLQMGALFAVSSLKHGTEYTFKNPVIRKTFYTWTINPIVTLFISYGLSFLIIGSNG